jgi:uncharacterized protein (TIGR03437 family)
MIRSGSVAQRMFAAAALLAAWKAPAQTTTLTYVDPHPCCLASDGRGNTFVVSSNGSFVPNGQLSVAKLDASGAVVSTLRLRVGASDDAAAATVDPVGRIWIVGATGLPQRGFIAELDPSGASVLFSGLFGGTDRGGTTLINAVAFDGAGNAYVAGSTSQSDFPLTPGFTGKFGGPSETPGFTTSGAPTYGFVAKLTPKLDAGYTVAYTAMLGGQQLDLPACPDGGQCAISAPFTSISAMTVDSAGIVTAAGLTNAPDFPVTAGAYQTSCACFLASRIGFITRLKADGSGVRWSTFLGSRENGLGLTVGGLVLDRAGSVIVDGATSSLTFPITEGAPQPRLAFSALAGAYNGFVAKLDSTGSRLLFSTYFGGALLGHISAPRLDERENIWLTEQAAYRSGLPPLDNSLLLGALSDSGVVAALAADGSEILFVESLPNGAAGQDLLLEAEGGLISLGPPRLISFGGVPDAANGQVIRHPRTGPSGISVLGVADVARNGVNSVAAPGEILAIYGTGLGPVPGIAASAPPGEAIAASLGGVSVLFDDVAVPVLYASRNQINVLAPYDLKPGAQTLVQVRTPEGSSQTLPLTAVAAQANVLTVKNADGTTNSPANPTYWGETIRVYLNGSGAVDSLAPNGTIAMAPQPAALSIGVDFSYVIVAPHNVDFRQITVTPDYAGSDPSSVVNLIRIDVPVPQIQSPDPSAKIVVRAGTASSEPFSVYISPNR